MTFPLLACAIGVWDVFIAIVAIVDFLVTTGVAIGIVLLVLAAVQAAVRNGSEA